MADLKRPFQRNTKPIAPAMKTVALSATLAEAIGSVRMTRNKES
jgi:hypothetical protein